MATIKPRTDEILHTDGSLLSSLLANMGGSGIEKSATAPTDTTKFWLDTTVGVLKYHNGTVWVAVKATWG